MKRDTYKEIIQKLRTTRRKESFIILFSGLFNALTFIVSVLFTVTLIELFAQGDVFFRGILFGFIVFSSIMILSFFLKDGLARFLMPKSRPPLHLIALRVGSHYPDVKDRLSNAVQIYQERNKPNGMSAELIEAAFDQITSYSKDKDYNVILDTKKLKNSALRFAVSLMIFLFSFFVFQSSFGFAFERIMNWNKSYLPPPPFSLSLADEQQTILRGKPAQIVIKASGQAPETIKLLIKEEKQKNYDEYILRLDTGDVYIYSIAAVKSNLQFYASAEWLTTNVITKLGSIQVVDLPQIRSLSGRVIYPAYTGLAPKDFDEQNADISALNGSTVNISVLSNKHIKSAQIVIEKNRFSEKDTIANLDTTYIQMSVKDNVASGKFTCNFNGFYQIQIIDIDGQTNPEPIRYSVVSGKDEYPTISLQSPTMNVELDKNAILPIRIAISDDYGFSSVKLHYKLIESKYSSPEKNYKQISIPLSASNSTVQDLPYVWDLKKLSITPEDKYEFFVEVFDNDIVNGPKSARTQTITVRLPSPEELMKRTDLVHEKVEKELQKIAKESDNLKKEMEAINRELLKKDKKELTWEEKKKVEDILKKQSELQKKVENLSQELSQTTDKLQQNNLLSPETLQKYLELQKLMQEVRSPELERLQRQMEQALQNMTPDQLQKAMQSIQFDEEKFRRSIERTMKILKRVQAEQKADAIAKRAEELNNQQNQLENQLKNTNPNDEDKRKELARKQQELRDELKSVNKELDELRNLMKEIGENEMPLSELNEAADELNYEETSQDMQEAASSIEKGDFKKSASKQQKASQKIKNFSQKMNELKDKMNDKVNREAQRQMQKALQDLLTTSNKQEKLRDKTQKSDFNSTKIPEFAKEQADLFESVSNVANSMAQLAEKSFAVTPQMGNEITNALIQMRATVEYLANRQMSQAAKSQIEAMKSLNSTIGQMQSMLSQMQNKQSSCDAGGGMGQGQSKSGGQGMAFQQRLQQLAAEQQAINQAMQQLGEGNNPGALSQEQRAQMARLADRQGRAQKSLQELAEEQRNAPDGNKLALGDLNRIAREMEEVARDIQSGNITPETRRKQERILSRLLDATKSIYDRDFEERRQGRTAQDIYRDSPNSADFEQFIRQNQYIQEMINNARRTYTKDYEQLIRKYFENLKEIKN